MFFFFSDRFLHEAAVLEAPSPSGQGEAGRAAVQPDLPPRQEHTHHQHPQGEEPQGQRHQRKVR